jgi:hypothetical protein
MKHTNSTVFGVFGIWDPTGYDLGLAGNMSQRGDVGLVSKYPKYVSKYYNMEHST